MNAPSILALWLAAAAPAIAATPIASTSAVVPAACPGTPVRVVRSAGGTIDYLGTVPGIPDLCRIHRTADGDGELYYGVWRSDWPGAGQAYPALKAVIGGAPGTQASFVTRSVPGLQWTDTFTNRGPETLEIDGVAHATLRIAHDRNGIDGNTYHSIITQWRDIGTGIALRTTEQQISGQSYGPDTTWHAVRIEPLPAAGR